MTHWWLFSWIAELIWIATLQLLEDSQTGNGFPSHVVSWYTVILCYTINILASVAEIISTARVSFSLKHLTCCSKCQELQNHIRYCQITVQTTAAWSFFTPTSACGSFFHFSQQPMFRPVLVRMFLLPIPNGAHQVGRSQNGDFRCFRRSHGRPSHISHRSPASVFYAPPPLHVTEFE